MNLLHQAGLVQRRKEGKWHFYRHRTGEGGLDVERLVGWLRDALADEPIIRGDARNLQAVLKRELVELAACYRS